MDNSAFFKALKDQLDKVSTVVAVLILRIFTVHPAYSC